MSADAEWKKTAFLLKTNNLFQNEYGIINKTKSITEILSIKDTRKRRYSVFFLKFFIHVFQPLSIQIYIQIWVISKHPYVAHFSLWDNVPCAVSFVSCAVSNRSNVIKRYNVTDALQVDGKLGALSVQPSAVSLLILFVWF